MSSELQFQLKELAIAILQSDSLTPKDIKSKALQLYNQAIIMEHEVLNGNQNGLEDTFAINSDEKAAQKASVATEIPSLSENIIEDYLNETVTQEIEKESILDSELDNPDIDEAKKIITEESIENERLEKEIVATEEESPSVEAPTLLQELEDLTADFNLPDFEPLQAEELPLANQEENPVESQQEEPLDTLEINAEEGREKTEKEVLAQLITEAKKEKTATSSTPPAVEKPLSLNDKLHSGFKIGLNDRLAFTQHLFAGNQEDFTRVISQLNTTPSLEEAVNFINEVIKPEYNFWEGKEPYETRFFELIDRNFQS